MSPESTRPAIAVRDLDFAYDGEPVLTDVTFSVDAGDFISVVGPNGGGKTTLLRLLLGLLRPQRGMIEIMGTSPEQARSLVGYVPQQFQYDPHFPMRVIDVVLMGRLQGLRPRGRFNRSDRDAALQALEKISLGDLSRRQFGQLSGGQRQRVLIARALASSPRLILLDEPTAHIDSEAEREVMDLLVRLSQEITIFMATHDVTFVSSAVKTVLCVNRRVRIHPTSAIPEGMHIELYGGDVRYVRHDHRIGSPEKEVGGGG